MRVAWMLLAALAAQGCSEPAPPPIAVRKPVLDAGDFAVMKGVLDHRLRPRGGNSARFLVVDTTMATCAAPGVLQRAPGACLDSQWMEFVSPMLPKGSLRTATLDFQARNARRLAIEPALGAGVTYISATVTDFMSSEELVRWQPPGSTVVMFSTPSYPAARMAVIAYAAGSDIRGAARLERQSDGQWMVTGNSQYGTVE